MIDRPLTYIYWKDACYNVDETPHELLGHVVELYEVGFIIKETDEAVTICSEWQEDAISSRLTITIPKLNIIERRDFTLDKIHFGRRKKNA